MPPPVSPATSVFNTTGISVDSPFSLGPPHQNHADTAMNGMVMPDAVPTMSHMDRDSTGRRSAGRRKHHDYVNPLSQGYAKTLLETVPELSGSPEHGQFSHSNGRRHNGHIGDSSSSSGEMGNEESNLLVFPSAADTPDYGAVHRQKRARAGDRRDRDSTVLSNKMAFSNGFGEEDDFNTPMKDYSPRQQGKALRREAREVELAKEKELLRRKMEEEERRRREQQKVKIAQDYSRGRSGTEQVPRRDYDGNVLKRALKFDAQAQLVAEEKLSQSIKVGSNWVSPQHSRESSLGGRRSSLNEAEKYLNQFDTQTTKL